VTSRGVSAADWVAAMDSPAFQPGSERPARKYSSRLRDARARARIPDATAQATKAVRISRSSMPRALLASPKDML
jgi:hypothetical protein